MDRRLRNEVWLIPLLTAHSASFFLNDIKSNSKLLIG